MQIHNLKPKKNIFSFCKLCKAKIFWTVTAKGKNMPVEFDEKIEYLFDGISKVYYEPKLMKAHWATCPYANVYRKD